jgi:hypothetical protein
MKRLFVLALVTACGGGLDSGSPGTGGEGGSSVPVSGSGVLTAGEIDDNKNLALFQAELDGAFAAMAQRAPLGVEDRIVVTARDASERPLSNANVIIRSGEKIIQLPTGTDGRLVLLPSVDGFDPANASIEVAGYRTDATAGNEWTITVPDASAAPPEGLDLAFVVDATGSMGDEIQFLKDEVHAIATRVAAEHEGVPLRFALVVYRDEGDDYVTRTFDFTGDLAKFTADLGKQSAGGGGDWPEAAHEAMDAAMQLAWRDGNIARVVFHIADAPAHEHLYRAFVETSVFSRELGIRVFPIAASGTTTEAEYLMRGSAMITGGRYLFLTDHSGVGNSHAEPHFPCYQVQRLESLLARTISSELAGTYIAASEADVIETVGNYRGGVCE